MLQLAPEGTHFAFEPLPQMFEELKETFSEIPNVILYDYALSNTSGSTHFQYVESNPSFSGFRQRKYQNPNERIQQITVKTDLLDNLIPKHTPIHFIKVDVEGAELQVFKGAIETIKNNRPVLIFEHGLGAADCYGTSPENLFDLLSGQCGLRIFLMEKWLGTSSGNSLSRVDFSEQFSSGSNYYFMAAP
jgi:FkbM family methyltransferase